MIRQTETPRQGRAALRAQSDQHRPSDIIVAVQEGDAGGMALATYYCQVRGIPLSNIELFPGTWRQRVMTADATLDYNAGTATAAEYVAILQRTCQIVRARPRVGAIVLMHWWPVAVDGSMHEGGQAGSHAVMRLMSCAFATLLQPTSQMGYFPARENGGYGVWTVAGTLEAAGGVNLERLELSGLRSTPQLTSTEGPVFFNSIFKPNGTQTGPNWARNWPANAYDIIVNQCGLPERFVRVPVFQIGGPAIVGTSNINPDLTDPEPWGPDHLPVRERNSLGWAKKLIDNAIAGEAARHDSWKSMYVWGAGMSFMLNTEPAWSDLTRLDVPWDQFFSRQDPARSDVISYYLPGIPPTTTIRGRSPIYQWTPPAGKGILMVGRGEWQGVHSSPDFILPGCISFGGYSYTLPPPGLAINNGLGGTDWCEVPGGGALIIHGYTWGATHIGGNEAGTSSGLIWHFSQGCCASEFWMHTHGATVPRSVIVGDPLYRPFAHWTGRYP